MLKLFLVIVAILALVVIMFFVRVRADGIEFRMPLTNNYGACNTYIFLEWTTHGVRSGRDSLCT